ncbi:MAG: endonuclease [Oscillospiraceae bacterium]|nr:endonuclease [Oscillospiraceae bacterium]
MKRLVSTLNLSHEEWLRYRKRGIGGSDAGAICGLNPYVTAMQVYHDKTSDTADDTDNEAMRQGRDLEEYVSQRFMEATGKKVRRANAIFYNEDNPFMLANVDRLLVGEDAGLECKTASPYMADKWKDGEIPMHYQIQCHHYMAVCDTRAWYIAVLIYGKEFKFHKIERDEDIITDLIQIEKDFWENNVLGHTLPAPDGSKAADTVISNYFKETKPVSILLPPSFDGMLEHRQDLVSAIDEMKKEKKQIEQELKLYMGKAETAENDQFKVSWKPVDSSRVDGNKLKEEQPEIYAKYQKTIHSRRFTINAA